MSAVNHQHTKSWISDSLRYSFIRKLVVAVAMETAARKPVADAKQRVRAASMTAGATQGVRQGINHLCVKNVSYSMRSLHN